MSAAKRRIPDRETVTTERVTIVAHWLFTAPGQRMTTAEIARRLEMTHNGAWRMLSTMSRVSPITFDKMGWYYCGDVPY